MWFPVILARLSVWPSQNLHTDTFQCQSWSLLKKIISKEKTTFYFENWFFYYPVIAGEWALFYHDNAMINSQNEKKKIVATMAALGFRSIDSIFGILNYKLDFILIHSLISVFCIWWVNITCNQLFDVVLVPIATPSHFYYRYCSSLTGGHAC